MRLTTLGKAVLATLWLAFVYAVVPLLPFWWERLQ